MNYTQKKKKKRHTKQHCKTAAELYSSTLFRRTSPIVSFKEKFLGTDPLCSFSKQLLWAKAYSWSLKLPIVFLQQQAGQSIAQLYAYTTSSIPSIGSAPFCFLVQSLFRERPSHTKVHQEVRIMVLTLLLTSRVALANFLIQIPYPNS